MEFGFEKLEVWQEAYNLAKEVHEVASQFPSEEQYGLVSQLNRAAISVPLNIAEGKGRYHKKEFRRFLYIARGSLYETIVLIRFAQDLEYINSNDYSNLMGRTERVLSKLSGLINSIKDES